MGWDETTSPRATVGHRSIALLKLQIQMRTNASSFSLTQTGRSLADRPCRHTTPATRLVAWHKLHGSTNCDLHLCCAASNLPTKNNPCSTFPFFKNFESIQRHAYALQSFQTPNQECLFYIPAWSRSMIVSVVPFRSKSDQNHSSRSLCRSCKIGQHNWS